MAQAKPFGEFTMEVAGDQHPEPEYVHPADELMDEEQERWNVRNLRASTKKKSMKRPGMYHPE